MKHEIKVGTAFEAWAEKQHEPMRTAAMKLMEGSTESLWACVEMGFMAGVQYGVSHYDEMTKPETTDGGENEDA